MIALPCASGKERFGMASEKKSAGNRTAVAVMQRMRILFEESRG